jgi:hypothetical protein
MKNENACMVWYNYPDDCCDPFVAQMYVRLLKVLGR